MSPEAMTAKEPAGQPSPVPLASELRTTSNTLHRGNTRWAFWTLRAMINVASGARTRSARGVASVLLELCSREASLGWLELPGDPALLLPEARKDVLRSNFSEVKSCGL